MFRFLFGFIVGAVATAAYLQRTSGTSSGGYVGGRVDELSSVEPNVVADPALNAGDSTPTRYNENLESFGPGAVDPRARSIP